MLVDVVPLWPGAGAGASTRAYPGGKLGARRRLGPEGLRLAWRPARDFVNQGPAAAGMRLGASDGAVEGTGERWRPGHHLVTGEAGPRFSQTSWLVAPVVRPAGPGASAVAGAAASGLRWFAEGVEPVADGADGGVVGLGQPRLVGAGVVALQEVGGGVEAAA